MGSNHERSRSLRAQRIGLGLSLLFLASEASAQSSRLPSPQQPSSAHPFNIAGPGAGASGQAGTSAAIGGPGSGGLDPGTMPGVQGALPGGQPAGAGDAAGLGANANAAAGANNADALNAALAARGDTDVGTGGSLGLPVIGDQGAGTAFRRLVTPGLPSPYPPPQTPDTSNRRRSAILAPSVRSFKIAENQSPRPQDRIYYSFNYFDNVNQDVNRRIGSPVDSMKVYRNIFGLEKTFADGYGSVGLRLPLYTLSARPAPNSGLRTPTSTALGDLGLYGKYIIWDNKETGSLISGGLVLSTPTGPSQFAGANYVNSIHSVQFQPFLGFIWNRNRFYVQGFSAIDVPTDNRIATLFYNDISFGYLIYRDDNVNSDALITAIAPTFEVHVNTPLNHQGAYNINDISGTSDNVNLTYGLNVELARNSVATFAMVTPVNSPKPFDFEAIFLLNIRFGASRQQRAFPVIGN